jgi:hypothetical protein
MAKVYPKKSEMEKLTFKKQTERENEVKESFKPKYKQIEEDFFNRLPEALRVVVEANEDVLGRLQHSLNTMVDGLNDHFNQETSKENFEIKFGSYYSSPESLRAYIIEKFADKTYNNAKESLDDELRDERNKVSHSFRQIRHNLDVLGSNKKRAEYLVGIGFDIEGIGGTKLIQVDTSIINGNQNDTEQ